MGSKVTNKYPLVSVIIVNWNGQAFLAEVLGKLQVQSFKDFEIIVVDNGSTDGSMDLLRTFRPQVRVECLPVNQGFAAANNIGAALSRGHWIALLNNDAFPQSNWLAALVSATERYSEFQFFASSLLMARRPGYLDGTGDIYHISGMAWRRDHGRKEPRLNPEAGEVFGPCGAAALYPRDLFIQTGGFDPDYFCYHEDVDLSFRLRLQGHRCLYVPEAQVQHLGSASSAKDSDFAIYHGHRNLVWTFIKNMPPPLLSYYLPAHWFLNLATLVWFTAGGQGRAISRAKRDALRGLPGALTKRKIIQKQRKAPVSAISQALDRHWLNPYWDFFARRRTTH